MGLPENSKQLVQWFQKSSGWLFKFLGLFRRVASVPFPSFLQDILTCNVLMTVNLAFDVKRSVVVSCDD